MTSSPRDRWTGRLGTFWAGHDEPYERMLAPLAASLLDAARIGPGARVLDIGCGPGLTTREAARRAGPTGSALGVDISAAMVATAREHAAAEGPANVEFRVADAERTDLGEGWADALISRFGLLFFDEPDTAFASLGRALRPGGRIAFTSWQVRARSPIRTVPAEALAPWIPLPPPPVAGAPGPFNLADPDRVRELLARAGFGDIDVTDLTLPLLAGTDAVSAAAFQIAEEDAERDEPLPPEATEAMVAAMRPYETPDGVFLTASTWLFSATR